ncbi:YdcF family protein [Phormidium sp. CCY1219]|uniref:YdcF family protein n=1 Tax=Phormidium sp. CCY1219 TaxID=2886104 RepID=UPI002D1EB805|nr:ElyC/SanA/YdcF family protein [Phormidium sp. CCY1219]MEB3828622.1 YdcF family protein [Phormidium sp. CCY1219]
MFLVITQILLWVIVAALIWYVLLQLIPREYLTWLGGAILFCIIVLAFFFPTEQGVSTLWQILSFPLKPLGLCIVLLILATKKEQKNRDPLIASTLAILVLCSIPWLSEQYEYWLIRSNFPETEFCTPRPAATRPARGKVGAIVLLANGITQPFLPYQPHLLKTQMSDRLFSAVEQYNLQRQLGNRPPVIIAARPKPFAWAGISAPWYNVSVPKVSEAEELKTLLVNLGIPSTDILLLDNKEVFNVRATAIALDNLHEDKTLPFPSNRIILISSALDMPRARLAFEKLDIPVTPRAPTLLDVLCDRQNRLVFLSELIPNAASFLRTTRVIEEFYTLMYYFLRGWIDPCTNCGAPPPPPTSSNLQTFQPTPSQPWADPGEA